MRKGIIIFLLALLLVKPVSAAEFTPPAVPPGGEAYMPADTESFGEGLWYVIKKAVANIRPELAEAARTCAALLSVVLLTSVVKGFQDAPKQVIDLISTIAVAALLVKPSNALIRLGIETVKEVTQYGKLLLPVMTAAMAAQGGVTASAALYTGSAFMNALLASAVSDVIVPVLCIYLAVSIANNAIADELLKNLKVFVKWMMTWGMKIILYVFTGYMGITGVVSGTADAAALKATKLTISGVVPVVGGILSDASEAILVGAGVMRSAAGIYGLFAVLAVCIGPFLKIGVQYLMLKITAAACGVFGAKDTVGMIRDFSVAMGFLLAMTGTACLLLMISTVCFMKEVG